MRHNGGGRERLLSRSPVNMPPLLPIAYLGSLVSFINYPSLWAARSLRWFIVILSSSWPADWLTPGPTRPGPVRPGPADCARATLHRAKNSDQSQHTTLPLFHHHHYQHGQQQQQPSRGGAGDRCVGRLWCIEDVKSYCVYAAHYRRSSAFFSLLRCCRATEPPLMSSASHTVPPAISHLALRKYCQLMLIRSCKVVVVVVVANPSVV